jgi:hypothetical protein
MRVKLKNTGKGALHVGTWTFDPNGTRWVTEAEMQALAVQGSALDLLIRGGKLTVVQTEADDIETQVVKSLVVQAPNGSLWQITVNNSGTFASSAYTAVAPHDNLNI